MKFRGTAVLVLLLALSASGCESPQDELPPSITQWSVSPEPAVVIGGADQREDYVLFGVAEATRLGDGHIVVTNGGSSELLVYDSLGTFVRRVGGHGNGPGEYKTIVTSRRLAGDTILVLSFRPGMTWISPTGAYVRSRQINLIGLAQLPCRLGSRFWVLGDGSLLQVLEDNFGVSGCPPTPRGVRRTTGLIARSVHFDGTFDTIAVMPDNDRNATFYRAYGRTLALAVGPDRIYAGDTGSSEILALSYDGDTLQALPTPFEPRPVPRAAKRKEERQGVDMGSPDRFGRFFDYPETYPRFARLLVDALGHLWVMAFPEVFEPELRFNSLYGFPYLPRDLRGLWRVIDPKGSVVAETRLPEGLYPLEIGPDYILGLTVDELGTEAVQVFGLTRNPLTGGAAAGY